MQGQRVLDLEQTAGAMDDDPSPIANLAAMDLPSSLPRRVVSSAVVSCPLLSTSAPILLKMCIII